MRSAVQDVLPGPVRRSLQKLGGDLALARRKRGLTAQMMAERTGVSRGTYDRLERGDARVAAGAYAMAIFVLGLGTPLGEIADATRDAQGLVLDAERLPKRVHPKTGPTAS